jgi:hypothetical protein
VGASALPQSALIATNDSFVGFSRRQSSLQRVSTVFDIQVAGEVSGHNFFSDSGGKANR